MIVKFDSSWLYCGGIGRFSAELSKRLQVICFSLSNQPAKPINILKFLFKTAFFQKNNVVFSPSFIPPLFSRCPYIFTIHDLNHLDIKANDGFLKTIFYNYIIRIGCLRAEKILTVSDFSRRRIIEWSGVSPIKVFNVGNGVDDSFSNKISFEMKTEHYFLCVSNRKLHKNEHRLIHAFAESAINSNIKLVFTGEPNRDLLTVINELGIEGKVVFKGRVADEDLPALYRGAMGLLFPSLYEGFGLPVVEAMASGIPVLTSNTTSLPEVAGDAALLINPESVDEIRVGIERLVHDEALRAELIAKGLERAKLFSWDAVAARVQAVLDEVTSQYGK
ncbi:glycosyltransferase family 4 protein [Aeromonas veronii]|uniref:glycosyltransferase family 4 protein n=1 Tax=Aeromonas veronii TaxID=654 RepID=UPI00191E3733|nr:glycosyltransferase family 1 protein [Aeromonas veronii]MBL0588331.1 glycosyltransferase family 4 protein [Aeromonas veronii]